MASEAPRELVQVDSWALSLMFDSGAPEWCPGLFQGRRPAEPQPSRPLPDQGLGRREGPEGPGKS